MTLAGGESGNNGKEGEISYDEDALGEGNPYYYEWTGDKKNLFPTLVVDEAHGP